MSSDDTIAIAYNKADGKWYVAHVSGDNISGVGSHGKAFTTKKDANVYAKTLNRYWHTEYGVRFYGDI